MNRNQLYCLVDSLGKFKDLKRTGWKNFGVYNSESDADHSFSLTLLALLLAPPELNRCRCMELALIHDLPEIIVGDITPEETTDYSAKAEKEKKAMQQIAHQLERPELMALFTEYEAQQTLEARFIKALDKLDNILTARYYDDTRSAKQQLTPIFSSYAQKVIEQIDPQNHEYLINIIKELNNKI